MSLSILSIGFLLGMRHAIEADHVAAVAALCAQKNHRAPWRQALAWGLGHSLSLGALVGVAFMLGSAIPDGVARGLEILVGLSLVYLGLDVLRRVRRDKIHLHWHRHQDQVAHVHPHSHAQARGHSHEHPADGRAFFIGGLHGFAGSAALLALTASQSPSGLTSVFYVLLFAVGSMVGMLALSALVLWPLSLMQRSAQSVFYVLQMAVAWLSCFLGLAVLYEQLSGL